MLINHPTDGATRGLTLRVCLLGRLKKKKIFNRRIRYFELKLLIYSLHFICRCYILTTITNKYAVCTDEADGEGGHGGDPRPGPARLVQAGDGGLPGREGDQHDDVVAQRPRLLRRHTPLRAGTHVSVSGTSPDCQDCK